MDIISFFYYNNKKFLIVKRGNKLLYCITENNTNRFNLSEDEKSIFSHVLSSITANPKESFFVRILSYNDIFYKLFFYPEKNLYYTDSIDSKIISYVNFNFNHVSEFCYIDNTQSDTEDKNTESDNLYFQRAIKIGKKLVFISTLAALSLNLLTGCSVATKNDDLLTTSETLITVDVERQEEKNPDYNGSIVFDRTQEEQDYDFSIIEDALESNINLIDEEKEFIRQLRFIFDENHEYMDVEMVKERLSTLKINYDSSPKGNYGGVYNSRDNEITLYNCTNFGDCHISCFIHEFLHVLQQPSNDFLKELSNEFFSRETVRKLYDTGIISEDALKTEDYTTIVPLFGDGYDDYIPTYYVLAELLDEETLRKYQFGCDTTTIIKGLSYDNDKIINQENAHAFIADINSARVYNEETQMFDLVSIFETEGIISKCYNDLNYYYKLKKGYEIKEDLQITINYYEQPNLSFIIIDKFSPYSSEEKEVLENLLIETANEQEDVEDSQFGFYRVVIPKTYLSNDHINPTISFNSSRSVPTVTVEITKKLAEVFKGSIENIKANNEERSQ